MSNPDLLTPGSTTQNSVPKPTKFKHILEDGRTVESVAAMPATKATEIKYYASSAINTNFIREDGKKIVFRNGFYETDLLYDQRYLDNEIVEGNNYIREATPEEVRAAHIRMNPVQTIKDELKNDPDFRAEIEADIRAQMLKAAEGGVKVTEIKTGSDNGATLRPLGAVSTTDLSGLLAGSNSK